MVERHQFVEALRRAQQTVGEGHRNAVRQVETGHGTDALAKKAS